MISYSILYKLNCFNTITTQQWNIVMLNYYTNTLKDENMCRCVAMLWRLLHILGIYLWEPNLYLESWDATDLDALHWPPSVELERQKCYFDPSPEAVPECSATVRWAVPVPDGTTSHAILSERQRGTILSQCSQTSLWQPPITILS